MRNGVAPDPAINSGAAAHAVDPTARPGRLFRKYLLLILTLVTGALLASGAITVYFSYQEHKGALGDLQHEKAVSAASRIEQYMTQIIAQLSYAALPQLAAADVELRRIEFLKLLRQVPEITDIAQLDADGREQISVSRLGMDRIGSGTDRSQEPAFRNARRGQPWIGPVYFRKETEPYLTIAVRSGGERAPVTIADINLKFIWEVVSRIKIGKEGNAYAVDGRGFLVAHPDIGLVLRKTNLSDLPQVAAALGGKPQDELAIDSRDLKDKPVLASFAPIDSLKWFVFVEQPDSEVYDKLNASFLRTGLLLLAGLVISALAALALARGMVRPIRTLSDGARRIGEGNLDQKIDVKTGDELEALANRFNRMSVQLKESYAGLERKVEERTHELQNSLGQQTAISDILRVISSSPTDVQPVLDAVAERAAHLCGAPHARVLLVAGDQLVPAAEYAIDGAHLAVATSVPLSRTSITGRAALDCTTIHHADIVPLLDSEFPDARPNAHRAGFRAILAVPLVREGVGYGAIFTYRNQPGLFSPDQVALVETFARQAAIAIDNVRLFNETKEGLDQQTAISEILRVISGSPTDVRPVLDAIAERALRLCDAAAASIYLIEGNQLRLLASQGTGPDQTPTIDALPIDHESMSGRAVLERRAIHVDDILAESADYPLSVEFAHRYGHRTVLVAPLFREGQPFGTILLRRSEMRPFTEREIALLKTFGDQAAIAIENVRLFNETKEALEQQQASGEVLSTISSSIADTKPVFDKILESCERLFAGTIVGVNLLDDDGTIKVGAFHGPGREELEKVVRAPIDEETGSGAAILRRSVLHCPDVENGAGVPRRAREGCAVVGIKAAIFAPMLWEGKGIGAIFVGRDHVGPFSDKDISLLKTFADQAVIAIQNARLFREIEDKSRQLEIANKHKSDFLANMSHELRTPLNAIIGFSEVLLEKLFGDLNEKQDDYLKDIHSSGRHLLALINDILDLSKIEAGRMELERSSFDLPTTLSDAMTFVRERALKHQIGLGLDIDPDVHEIVADERKVKQVLVNLLTNAVKFTPDGGRVSINARREPGQFVIAVRDTGIGIAVKDHETVFEEFRQVGGPNVNKPEGTGLGLPLARKFVELHGGRIWLESAPGAGSTFSFTLPDPP